eukprot:3931857-Rhodomonas_salina.1
MLWDWLFGPALPRGGLPRWKIPHLTLEQKLNAASIGQAQVAAIARVGSGANLEAQMNAGAYKRRQQQEVAMSVLHIQARWKAHDQNGLAICSDSGDGHGSLFRRPRSAMRASYLLKCPQQLGCFLGVGQQGL